MSDPSYSSSSSSASSPFSFRSSSAASNATSAPSFGFGSSAPSFGFSFSSSSAASNCTSAPSFGFSLSSSSGSSLFAAVSSASNTALSSHSFGSVSSSGFSSSPFGVVSTNRSSSSSSFGSSTPSKPLFGTPATATSSASTTPVSSPFGTSTPSLFGTPSTHSSSASPFGTTAPSLFASPSSSSSPFATTTPSLFATPSSSSSPFATTAPSLFATPSSSTSTTTTSLFSNQSSTATATTNAAPISSPSSFSAQSSTATAFATPSTSSAASSSFAGFASATASTGAASFTGFSLSTKTAAPATPSHPQSTTAAAPLFGTSASTSAATTASSSGASTTQTLSLSVASSSGTTSSVSTTVSAAIKLPSEITGKTVEEIIKEWNAELQECTGKFRKQAAAIAEWDKRILQNCDVLLKLEIDVSKVVETQANLERQLELIETHQQEVDKALESIEEAERIYKDDRGLLLDDEAASTRDAMYEQAEFVERELEQMTEKIKSVIQTLNANQDGELDAIDGMTPLDVVVRILNNQLSSLLWIDEKDVPSTTLEQPTTPSKQPSLSQVLRDMEDDFVAPPSSPLPPTLQTEAITIEESDDEDQLTLQEGLLAQDNKNKKQVTGEIIPTGSPQVRETPRDEEATTKVTHMPLSSSLVAASLPQASNVLEVPISSGFAETSAPVSEREKPSESTFVPTTTPSISGKITPEKDFDVASKLQALSSQTAGPIDPHLSPVEVSPVELSDDFLRRNVQQAQMRTSSYLTRSDSGSSEELLPPLDTQLIVGLSHGQAAVELPRSDAIFLDPPPEAFSQHSTHLMELLNCTADLKEFMSRFMDKDSWQAISFLRKLPGVPTQIHFCLRLIAENWRFANSACGDFYRKGFPEALHFSLHRVRVVQNGKKDECQQSIIATKERIRLLEEQLDHERNELAALEAILQDVMQDEVVSVRKEIIRQISSVSFNTRSSCRDALEQVVQWCKNPRSED